MIGHEEVGFKDSALYLAGRVDVIKKGIAYISPEIILNNVISVTGGGGGGGGGVSIQVSVVLTEFHYTFTAIAHHEAHDVHTS